MPKSAVDATRFTSTTPHASAKPPQRPPLPPAGASDFLPRRAPGPAGETPQQRVKRLREAANRARDAQISGFDKVIARGRVWADRAHRVTALGLIGVTAIAGVITVYALGDMIIHNRHKRREYFAQQAAVHTLAVHEAQSALRQGTASEEQRALLESEEAERRRADATKKAAEEAKEGKGGAWAEGKKWLLGGLKREQAGQESEGESAGTDEVSQLGQVEHGGKLLSSSSSPSSEERMRHAALGIGTAPGEEGEGLSSMGRESAVMRAVEEKKAQFVERAERSRAREQEREKNGGMLDRLGTVENANDGHVSSTVTVSKHGEGGWFGFMGRR